MMSCSKEDKFRRQLSGVYEVQEYRQEFYNDGELSNTTSINDFGSIGLYDNDINPYNSISENLDTLPHSWDQNGVGVNGLTVGWYTDEVNGETLNFFSEKDNGESFFMTFTIEHGKGKNAEWVYVEITPFGKLKYKEIWKVRKM
jgi:hypothetical protein